MTGPLTAKQLAVIANDACGLTRLYDEAMAEIRESEDSEELMAALEELYDSSLIGDSQRRYTIVLEQNLDKYGYTRTYSGLIRRILHPEPAAEQTFLLLRCATWWWMNRTGQIPPTGADKKRITDLISRKCKKDGTQGTATGPITGEKLEQLLKHAGRCPTSSDDVWNLRVKYFTGLRTCEVHKLTFSQFGKDAEGHFFVTEKKHSAYHAARQELVYETHRIPIAFAAEIAQERVRRYLANEAPAGPEALKQTVTRGWNTARLLKHVHETALAHAWDTKMNWVLHGLRHGLAVEASVGKTGAAAHAAVAAVTGQSSVVTTSRYRKTEVQRVAKDAKNKGETAAIQAALRGRGKVGGRAPAAPKSAPKPRAKQARGKKAVKKT